MGKIDDIYKMLQIHCTNTNGITALELANLIKLDRTSISRYLNRLCEENRVQKLDGRPVHYRPVDQSADKQELNVQQTNSIDKIIGASQSLKIAIQQAKAAILYPPRGLHVLILGETGVGKSMFAETMCNFAREMKIIKNDSPFMHFNCADYADNPQLLIAQIFGVKKGAYSGADEDRDGLLKKADGGIFFLDEVHRLTPQGQEMLFTFIDKGFFRPLGETSKVVYSSVQLIAATTEDPQSHLLKTFMRRIPMTISLPALKERKLEERYCLIQNFIQNEAQKLQKDIYVQYNTIISFLLYDCPNNIGQLKSDIQLACARAFLYFHAKNQSYILIKQNDLPRRVKRGILKLQEYRQEVTCFMDKKDDVFIFSFDNPEGNIKNKPAREAITEKENFYFYDVLLKKMEDLQTQGLDQQEIRTLVNIDIESDFKKYLSDLPDKFHREELTKVVQPEILDLVEELLDFAEEKLQREYDEKVYCGFALHLSKSLERIELGFSIYHPQLNRIRKEHSEEFVTAVHMAKHIEQNMCVEIPFDEIGYIAMFLIPTNTRLQSVRQNTVQILVLMHGASTAHSMAQVANTLTSSELVRSIDMPLSMKVDDMYDQVKEEIKRLPTESGILLLVDMGSLNNFADMISEDLDIQVRCIDLVSTPIVIEACRKSLDGKTLDDIYYECRTFGKSHLANLKNKDTVYKLLIITTCFTGDGAALYLKEYLEKSLAGEDSVKIKALNILDRNEFLCCVQALSKEYQIIAIVGTVDFPIEKIPFLSAVDILGENGIDNLRKIIEIEKGYQKIKISLQKHITNLDAGEIISNSRNILEEFSKKCSLMLSDDVKMGIVIHILFMMDRIINCKATHSFPELENYHKKHENFFQIGQTLFRQLEYKYNIAVPVDELAFVICMCLQNNMEVEKP